MLLENGKQLRNEWHNTQQIVHLASKFVCEVMNLYNL